MPSFAEAGALALYSVMRAELGLTRLGRARSSKKTSRNSSRDRLKTKSSSPSPSLLLALAAPSATAAAGGVDLVAGRNWSLPILKMVTRRRDRGGNDGSEDPGGMETSSPLSRSRNRASRGNSAGTPPCGSALEAADERCRLTRFVPAVEPAIDDADQGSRIAPVGRGRRGGQASRRLAHPQVPLAQQAAPAFQV